MTAGAVTMVLTQLAMSRQRPRQNLLLHGGGVDCTSPATTPSRPRCVWCTSATRRSCSSGCATSASTVYGPIVEQDHGLRESIVTDSDGNQVRIGSPIR